MPSRPPGRRAEGAPGTTTIGMLAVDLAGSGVQVCAIGPQGAVLQDRALSRARLATRPAVRPACIVTTEACAASQHRTGVALREVV